MPTLPFPVTTAITAGGQSRRFGRDKAQALWRGQTLLWHAAQALEFADEKILIVPPGRAALPGWRSVPDTRPGEGPLAGLEAALRAAKHDWVAFTGVDVPTLTPAYWVALLAQAGPACLSVQARDVSGQAQPLGALYHRSLLAAVTALLDGGERRLRRACPPEKAAFVDGLPQQYFRNINTPADLAALDTAGEAGNLFP